MLKRHGFVLETYHQKLNGLSAGLVYGELLQTEEWQVKRKKIIDREEHRCQMCHLLCIDLKHLLAEDPFRLIKIFSWIGMNSSGLQVRATRLAGSRSLTEEEKLLFAPQSVRLTPNVHHTFYVLNRLPWQYSNNSLMLVCHLCHSKIHSTQTIPVYKDSTLEERINMSSCSKCDGSGYLPEYDYFKSGICFGCGGTGFKELAKG